MSDIDEYKNFLINNTTNIKHKKYFEIISDNFIDNIYTVDTQKIQNFINLLKENNIIDKVINVWNNTKLAEFEKLYFNKPFKHIFKHLKTQDITKQIAPLLYAIFENEISKSKIKNFKIEEVNGYDYIYEDVKIEAKITLSRGNSWTGNGTKKKPWHLLFKFKLDENGKIVNSFVLLVNISKCSCSWSKPKDTSTGGRINFSTLRFQQIDKEHLNIIKGNLTKNQNRKYINFDL